MVKCPNPDCGYENVDGTQFCEGCGEELTQAAVAAAPAASAGGEDLIKCPACENLNPSDNVVCEVCGTELQTGSAAGTAAATAAAVSPASAVGAAPAIAPDTVVASDPMGTAVPPGSIDSAAQADLSPGAGLTTPPDADAPVIAIPGVSDSSPADELSPVVAAGDTTSAVTTPDTLNQQLSAAPPAGGGLAPGGVRLVVEQGMTVGKQFVLGDPEILVGREDEDEQIYPDIDLSDQDEGYVHRRHATLKFEAGSLTVEHLGGANKTRLNNRPLPDNEPSPVKIGDKIAFGKVVMRVQSV